MNILFVDDEPQILRGIERALDAANVNWGTHFATSGKEALEILENLPMDAIVTDMRMPGMDGARLLEQVAIRHPGVVRLVLSGQATREAVYRAVNPMHQYLAKPCDIQELTTALKKSLALRDMLASPRLCALIGKISQLPSTPETYNALVRELNSNTFTATTIGEIVARDPAMTAKVLQIVNSAVFGLKRRLSSPTQAVSILGAETVKALVLSIGVFGEYEDCEVEGVSASSVARHSLTVAEVATRIARFEQCCQEEINEIFTAALLHDVGKLILASESACEYAFAVQTAHAAGKPVWQAEQETLGATHANVGAYLFSLWGLSQSVIEAVGLHHTPNILSADGLSPLSIVAIANHLVHAVENPTAEVNDSEILQHMYNVRLVDRLSIWQRECVPVEA